MEEKVYFKNSKGDKLYGILSNPSGDTNKPIIILCHGFSTTKDNYGNKGLEKRFSSKNIPTFRFDFYGHGESEGKFEDVTISEAVDDVFSAIDFLKEKGYEKIGLMGSSFGGMASFLTAARRDDLFVLAVKCPVSDYLGKLISQESKYNVKEWKEKGFTTWCAADGRELKLNYSFFEDAEKIDGYAEIKNIKIPTLIIHGDEDKNVPVEQSKKSAELIKDCKLVIMKGANHFFDKPGQYEKMLDTIFDFIMNKIN